MRLFPFTFSTFTIISIGPIDTLGPIQTGRAGTLIYVYLAHFTTESCDRNTRQYSISTNQFIKRISETKRASQFIFTLMGGIRNQKSRWTTTNLQGTRRQSGWPGRDICPGSDRGSWDTHSPLSRSESPQILYIWWETCFLFLLR